MFSWKFFYPSPSPYNPTSGYIYGTLALTEEAFDTHMFLEGGDEVFLVVACLVVRAETVVDSCAKVSMSLDVVMERSAMLLAVLSGLVSKVCTLARG